MEPGQRIPELELCALLRVSRTPVREALRRLQSEGMVVHAPGGGLAVAQLDVTALSELYDLRESLEGTAAALAARNADSAEINVLRAILASQRKLPADPAIHARENKKFHQHIYRAAHNRFLWKCLGELHDAVALLGTTTFVAKGRPRQAWEEHSAIVSAIADRDPVTAEAAARNHVRRAFAIREAQLSRGAQFGAPDRLVTGADAVSRIR